MCSDVPPSFGDACKGEPDYYLFIHPNLNVMYENGILYGRIIAIKEEKIYLIRRANDFKIVKLYLKL